jgi:hypothetical protein
VLARRTRVITAATAIESVAIAAVLFTAVGLLDLVGATAAAAAILAGRLCGNLFLASVARASGTPSRAPSPPS